MSYNPILYHYKIGNIDNETSSHQMSYTVRRKKRKADTPPPKETRHTHSAQPLTTPLFASLSL